MSHPNILSLEDSYEDKNTFCLISNLMCDDLRNLLIDSKYAMEEAHAKKLFQQMLHAVMHVHKNSLIHRDIKLENFLVEINEKNPK